MAYIRDASTAMVDEDTLRRGVGINLGASRDIVLPHDPKAESSVLSAMLASEEVLGECVAQLRESDFFLGRHRVIFRAIAALFDRNLPADPVSIVDHLQSEGTLDRAGGASYVNDLATDTFALVAWRHHADMVRRDSMLRDLITAAAEISALAMDAPEDTKEVVEKAEKLLYDSTSRDVRENSVSLESAMGEVFDLIRQRAESGNDFIGISTGFKRLDSLLMGLRGGQLVVVGARPAVGKTSFALNLAMQAARPNAKDAGAAVAFFSLEMSRVEIAQRLLSSASGVDHTKIVLGKVDDVDWPQLISTLQYLSRLDMTIDDTPGTTVTEIRAKARRILRNKTERGLIIVDYLQLLSPAGRRSQDSRATEVSEMSRGLKILAKDLDVPVIALSQLNRSVAGTTRATSRRPQLSDLRESGSIEQDADVVILMDKSDKPATDGSTPPDEVEKDRPAPGMTDFIVAKNRSGPTGIVSMRFAEKITHFFEIETRSEY